MLCVTCLRYCVTLKDALGGEVERALFVVVLRVDDGAHLEQLVDGGQVALLARVVQRRVAVVVLLVHVAPHELREKRQ